jgi:hypothetical protein
MHIHELELVLDKYHKHIVNFEHINIEDDANCLDRDKYLICPALCDALIYRFKNKNMKSNEHTAVIYLIVFSIIKK